MQRNDEHQETLDRIQRRQQDLASQAAALAVERERLRELEEKLAQWAEELSYRAMEIERREEAARAICAPEFAAADHAAAVHAASDNS